MPPASSSAPVGRPTLDVGDAARRAQRRGASAQDRAGLNVDHVAERVIAREAHHAGAVFRERHTVVDTADVHQPTGVEHDVVGRERVGRHVERAAFEVDDAGVRAALAFVDVALHGHGPAGQHEQCAVSVVADDDFAVDVNAAGAGDGEARSAAAAVGGRGDLQLAGVERAAGDGGVARAAAGGLVVEIADDEPPARDVSTGLVVVPTAPPSRPTRMLAPTFSVAPLATFNVPDDPPAPMITLSSIPPTAWSSVAVLPSAMNAL